MERRLELSSGIEVELRTVPPYVLFRAQQAMPALPDVPTKEVETPAGTQRIQIDDLDDPRYKTYMREYEEAKGERMFSRWAVVFSHGIKRWRKKPKNIWHQILAKLHLGYHWHDQPPDSWDIPAELKDLIGTTGSRRLDYIYTMLLADGEDFAKVFQWLLGGASELTSEEVEGAEGSFRPTVEGNRLAEAEGSGDSGPDDLRGDEVGDEAGIDTQ